MRKKLWLIVRLLLVASGVPTGIVCVLEYPTRGLVGSFPSAVFFWFVFPAVALLFVVGMQVANPRSDAVWIRPSWNTNPFGFGQPLQFFHVGAYHFLVAGATALFMYFSVGSSALAWAAQLALLGAGTWLGVRLCILVFRRKMEAV